MKVNTATVAVQSIKLKPFFIVIERADADKSLIEGTKTGSDTVCASPLSKSHRCRLKKFTVVRCALAGLIALLL